MSRSTSQRRGPVAAVAVLVTAGFLTIAPAPPDLATLPKETVAVDPEETSFPTLNGGSPSEPDEAIASDLRPAPTQEELKLEQTVRTVREEFGEDAPKPVRKLLQEADEMLAAVGEHDNAKLTEKGEEIRTEVMELELDEIFANGGGSVVVANPATGEVLFARDPDQRYTSASTYKLFVMYDMLRRMEAGKLEPSSWLDAWSANECIDLMILESQNECPQEWMYQMGYPHMQKVADRVGARRTLFEFGNLKTTAADLAEFLGRLYRGELLTEKNTERALDLMSRQEFRDGIPAGVGKSVVVADKVGWLDEVYHDAGIIYSPKGDFVIVIMTEYLPVSAIAEAAAAIYEWL